MDIDKFSFLQEKKQIEASFVKDGWVTIYDLIDDGNRSTGLVYCCIVDSKRISRYKQDTNWVIRMGFEGKPAIIQSYSKGRTRTTYQTYSDEGIEPFIFWKSFSFGTEHDSYVDISEEFVLYFKLYEKGTDKRNRKFYFIDDSGDLDEVIVVEPERIKVKLKYLIEYISVRKVYLSICFDFMRFIDAKIASSISAKDEIIKNGNVIYSDLVRSSPANATQLQGWIHGKLIIDYDKKKTKGYHFDYEKQIYEKFITGYDKHGNEILQDCDADNSKAFVITYFRKEVLDKYYNDPSKYEVDGFTVSCKFFHLSIDNNIENYVAVFLEELGMLPYKEQLHWKQYNIPPQKGVSSTFYKTMIEGSWAEHPETADLYFKHKYQEFNKKWEQRFGWKFYKELAKEDEHLFTSLHIPTSDNVKSFCEQILTITKITLDRLNEAEIQKGITLDPKDRGIKKLEKFLKANGCDLPDMISFLRSLWSLRSGLLAHSFSKSNKDCTDAMEYFNIREGNYIQAAKDIFIKSIYTLNSLEKSFLDSGITHNQ